GERPEDESANFAYPTAPPHAGSTRNVVSCGIDQFSVLQMDELRHRNIDIAFDVCRSHAERGNARLKGIREIRKLFQSFGKGNRKPFKICLVAHELPGYEHGADLQRDPEFHARLAHKAHEI